MNLQYSFTKKDETKIYRCTEYKTMKKCKSLVILKGDKDIIKYEDNHNHLENEKAASISLAKHLIKEEINKTSNKFDIQPKTIYKEKINEIGFVCPEYNTIRSQINRNINKLLPKDISSFDDIPAECQFYKTETDEDYMIFKNNVIIIFQSPFQANLFYKYSDDIFVDGTFYIAPKCSYQVFITRNYVRDINTFYTTSFSILKNKQESTYEILFKEIKKNVRIINNNIDIHPKYFHCDFEKGISNAVLKVFPSANIKYCIWHYKRSLEINKNKICFKEVEENNDLYIYYKAITNFPFINSEYIIDIFNKIKSKCQQKNHNTFLNFLEYYKKTYILSYEIKFWNYFENIEHITNNVSESYNNYLNNLFSKKPTFFKLLYILQKEETSIRNDYERRIAGIWKKRKSIYGRTDEIDILINYYKDLEKELNENDTDRNELIELWYKCLIKLNNKNIYL